MMLLALQNHDLHQIVLGWLTSVGVLEKEQHPSGPAIAMPCPASGPVCCPIMLPSRFEELVGWASSGLRYRTL